MAETTKKTDEQTDDKTEVREEMVSKKRYDELLERLDSYDATLRTLQSQQQQPAPRQPAAAAAPVGGILADLAKTVADELGSPPEEIPIIKSVLRITDTYANRLMQQQLVPVLSQIVERLDTVEARSAFSDYADFADEIESERTRRAAQGQYASRSELYHVVRGRNVDKLVERAKATPADPATDVGDGMNGTTTVKTGPAQGARATPTSDDLAAMSAEERKARLEELTF